MLHPDLKEYLFTMPNGWKALQHPLVFSVPYTEVDFLVENLNKMYEYKSKAMAEAVEKKDFHKMFALYERPYRIEVLKNDMPRETFLDLLRQVWIDSENIYQNLSLWVGWMKPLVGQDAFDTLSGLPDSFTVYRGGRTNKAMSWTLDKDKALWFANRFGKSRPLWQETISKSQAVAYFTDRSEEEIVWIPKGL